MKWDRVTGMTHYRIYASKKEDSGYKLVKTVSAGRGSLSFSKFGNTRIKNNGTYYVYITGVKKVGSHTYTSGLNYVWKVEKSKVNEMYINTSN